MKPIYLYVTPFFPSPTNWRCEFSLHMVKAIAAAGQYDVRVFVPGSGEDYEYGGIRVSTFRTRQLPSAILPFLFRKGNERSFEESVAKAHIDWADVAVCHANVAMFGIYALAAKRHNPKCLAILHHHDQASFGLNLGRLRHFWPHKVILYRQLRAIHEEMDLHAFVCAASERNFRAVPKVPDGVVYEDYRRQMRWLGFLRPPRIKDSIVLHMGANEDLFHAETEVATKRDPAVFAIGCIANFQPLKDHLTLLKALKSIDAELGAWHLTLIGSGETLPACRQYVAENALADKVEFRTEVRQKELPAFYHSLDLFVLPSYFEGIGTVDLEAAACGVPFIACHGQGADDLLSPEERNRWFVPVRAPEALARKILWVARERPRQTLSAPVGIRAIVEEYLKELADRLPKVVP